MKKNRVVSNRIWGLFLRSIKKEVKETSTPYYISERRHKYKQEDKKESMGKIIRPLGKTF